MHISPNVSFKNANRQTVQNDTDYCILLSSFLTFILLISCGSHFVFRDLAFFFYINRRDGRCNDWDADFSFSSNCIERKHLVDHHKMDLIKNVLQGLKIWDIDMQGREKFWRWEEGKPPQYNSILSFLGTI